MSEWWKLTIATTLIATPLSLALGWLFDAVVRRANRGRTSTLNEMEWKRALARWNRKHRG